MRRVDGLSENIVLITSPDHLFSKSEVLRRCGGVEAHLCKGGSLVPIFALEHEQDPILKCALTKNPLLRNCGSSTTSRVPADEE